MLGYKLRTVCYQKVRSNRVFQFLAEIPRNSRLNLLINRSSVRAKLPELNGETTTNTNIITSLLDILPERGRLERTFDKLENPIALYNCNYVYFLQTTIDYMKCFCRLALKITFIQWIANFGSRYQFKFVFNTGCFYG